MRALRAVLHKIDHYSHIAVASHPGGRDNGPFPLTFLTPYHHGRH